MTRQLIFTDEAAGQLEQISKNPAKTGLYKQLQKTLGLMETNLRHPSLNTHEYSSLKGPNGEKIFEAYVQNNTPGAYRVFFYYGPDIVLKGKRTPALTVLMIVAHPK
ncbi:MAG TPA: hypothetical protein VG754_00890 [Verrucomicrobiae bacterium]|jgi:hypothetical protein|nr:hypothetical protein [Verrucomicrobiae bacterium]